MLINWLLEGLNFHQPYAKNSLKITSRGYMKDFKILLAIVFFAFQIVSAQSFPKNCIDEILAAKNKKPNVEAQEFLKELSTTVVKTKAQLKLPFGKPADSKITDIGVSVACIKVFPESPAQLANAIKDIGMELAKSTAQKAVKGAANSALGVANSALGTNTLGQLGSAIGKGIAPGAGQAGGAGGAAAVPAGPVLKKCDFVFNPEKKFCYDGAVYDKCDGMEFNPTTHFCSNDVAHRALCNNIQYNPSIQRCENNAIEIKCGDAWHNPTTHSCYKNSRIVVKCGKNPQPYDPDLYECKPSINANGIFRKTPVEHGGEYYEAVLLGEQVWLTKNLKNLGGSVLSNASDGVCYNNDANNCSAYGKLFDFETAKTACPAGWYLPSDAEWTTLTDYIGGSAAAAGKLKARNFGGTDEYGFSALPGGFGISGGPFGSIGEYGYWWSSTEASAEGIYNRQIGSSVTMNRGQSAKNNFFSVRCLQYADAAKRKNSFFLNVASEPVGAVLKFNNAYSSSCSKTPCKIELKEGKYNINVALSDYESVDTTITVTGERYLNIKLASTFGTLNVKNPGYSNSVGENRQWNFTINDKPFSFGELRLSPGIHVVKLTHDCYKDIIESVAMQKGQHIEFNPDQKIILKQSSLILNATYKGSAVKEPFFVNGAKFGETPFSGSVPLCSEIAFDERDDDGSYGKKPIKVNLSEDKPFEYTHKQSIFWSTFFGTAFNLAGLGFLGAGIFANWSAKDYNDEYKALGINDDQSEFSELWDKQEKTKTKRNVYYIIGSVLLVSGIGVHIWF